MRLCGGSNLSANLWKSLGAELQLVDEWLEKILEEGSDLEKKKQCVLNVCSFACHLCIRCASSEYGVLNCM